MFCERMTALMERLLGLLRDPATREMYQNVFREQRVRPSLRTCAVGSCTHLFSQLLELLVDLAMAPFEDGGLDALSDSVEAVQVHESVLRVFAVLEAAIRGSARSAGALECRLRDLLGLV
jgi:hypothetical protein